MDNADTLYEISLSLSPRGEMSGPAAISRRSAAADPRSRRETAQREILIRENVYVSISRSTVTLRQKKNDNRA